MSTTGWCKGVVLGALLGAFVRYGLTWSQTYHPGWQWWFEHGLRVPPGTAGFAGYVDASILMANYQDKGYCMIVALFPGLIGGVIGAISGAIRRPVLGAITGGLLSGLVLLLMRLPELYRPNWFGNLWLDYHLPALIEVSVVGIIVGALASGFARLCRKRCTQIDKQQ